MDLLNLQKSPKEDGSIVEKISDIVIDDKIEGRFIKEKTEEPEKK